MTVKSVYAEAWTLQNHRPNDAFRCYFLCFMLSLFTIVHSRTISFHKISYYMTRITHYS